VNLRQDPRAWTWVVNIAATAGGAGTRVRDDARPAAEITAHRSHSRLVMAEPPSVPPRGDHARRSWASPVEEPVGCRIDIDQGFEGRFTRGRKTWGVAERNGFLWISPSD
jgi:hypothetical protein